MIRITSEEWSLVKEETRRRGSPSTAWRKLIFASASPGVGPLDSRGYCFAASLTRGTFMFDRTGRVHRAGLRGARPFGAGSFSLFKPRSPTRSLQISILFNVHPFPDPIMNLASHFCGMFSAHFPHGCNFHRTSDRIDQVRHIIIPHGIHL